MGLLRNSFLSISLLCVLGFSQDYFDDDFNLPELPKPAKEAPAAQNSVAASSPAETVEQSPSQARIFKAIAPPSAATAASAEPKSSANYAPKLRSQPMVITPAKDATEKLVDQKSADVPKNAVSQNADVPKSADLKSADIPKSVGPKSADIPVEKSIAGPAAVTPSSSAAATTKPATDVPKPSKPREGVVSHKIPEKLDRPVRVGVFINEKNLYIKLGNEELKITAEGNQLFIKGATHSETVDSREFYSEGKCLNISPQQKQLSSSCYPGYFIVKAKKSLVTAINIVDVEDYIRGVIPYEIGKLDSNRYEALKAQAVAARTYVYKHFDSRDALGFDVYADTKDQVYKGYQAATPLTDAAVAETAGEVMTYNGDFIIAYYHSTCGGQTESLQTWEKKNLPYLKSKPDLRPNGKPWCDESSYNSWERKFSDKEVSEMFRQNVKEAKAVAPNFKKVKDIAVRKSLPSGRILILQVLTDKGVFNVIGDKVRWLFKTKGTILPSSFFSIYHEGHQWVLKGKGFGHGVGMCQMGVRARAQAGQSYLDILNHYYTDITLERFEH